MKINKTDTFYGIINMGLQRGYTNEYFEKEDIYTFLQDWQKIVFKDNNFPLCPALNEYDLMVGMHIEKHLALRFINFPTMNLTSENFKKILLELSQKLMHKFEQNRMLIEFSDETFLFEQSSKWDQKRTHE